MYKSALDYSYFVLLVLDHLDTVAETCTGHSCTLLVHRSIDHI